MYFRVSFHTSSTHVLMHLYVLQRGRLYLYASLVGRRRRLPTWENIAPIPGRNKSQLCDASPNLPSLAGIDISSAFRRAVSRSAGWLSRPSPESRDASPYRRPPRYLIGGVRLSAAAAAVFFGLWGGGLRFSTSPPPPSTTTTTRR